MSFVKLTGERGQDVWVKPVWVFAVEGHRTHTIVTDPDTGARNPAVVENGWTTIRIIGGEDMLLSGYSADIVATLYPPTEPKRTTVRRVAAE